MHAIAPAQQPWRLRTTAAQQRTLQAGAGCQRLASYNIYTQLMDQTVLHSETSCTLRTRQHYDRRQGLALSTDELL